MRSLQDYRCGEEAAAPPPKDAGTVAYMLLTLPTAVPSLGFFSLSEMNGNTRESEF